LSTISFGEPVPTDRVAVSQVLSAGIGRMTSTQAQRAVLQGPPLLIAKPVASVFEANVDRPQYRSSPITRDLFLSLPKCPPGSSEADDEPRPVGVGLIYGVARMGLHFEDSRLCR